MSSLAIVASLLCYNFVCILACYYDGLSLFTGWRPIIAKKRSSQFSNKLARETGGDYFSRIDIIINIAGKNCTEIHFNLSMLQLYTCTNHEMMLWHK